MAAHPMTPVEDFCERILAEIQPMPPYDQPLGEAMGLPICEDVVSPMDLPSFTNSAMDGYAVVADDLRGASEESPVSLPVVGEVAAGRASIYAMNAGTVVKIMTGAPVPAGCDTVVPLEDVEEEGEVIRLRKDCTLGQHVRGAGEEFRCGDLLLEAGTCLRAGEIGLLAAAGFARVRVHPAPRVAILSTGDELVDLGEQPGPGQIVNSNLHLLSARLREAGADVISLGIALDDEADLDQRLRAGLQADLLLTSGGVSVGDKDQVQDAFGRHGFKKIFWKVAIKPGKPVLFGKIGSQPVFGLPGNPASSAATCEIFTIPALRRLAGHKDPLPPRLKVRLAAPVKGGGKRQTFLWGSLTPDIDGYRFSPSNRQGSGQNRSLLGACALLPVPIGSPDLSSGAAVEVLLMRLPQGESVY